LDLLPFPMSLGLFCTFHPFSHLCFSLGAQRICKLSLKQNT
jgi:hypothetical protein